MSRISAFISHLPFTDYVNFYGFFDMKLNKCMEWGSGILAGPKIKISVSTVE